MLVARRKGKFVVFFFQDVHLVNISPCDLLGSPLQNFRCLLLECHIHRDSDPSRDGESLIYVRMLRQRLLLEQQQQKTNYYYYYINNINSISDIDMMIIKIVIV